MNPRFTQPKGAVSEETNLEAISRIFGIQKDLSEYIRPGLAINNFKVIYDEHTQTCWNVGVATGAVTSFTVDTDTLTVVTGAGTYKLNKARAVDMELLFKNEQHVQYYYNMLGNWDDAIFRAQMNVYLKDYSPKLVFPSAEISLQRPILGGVALGDYIHATYPELQFYNATTGKYKASWPLIIEGVYRKQQDGGTGGLRGTQFIFRGCANRTDMTWANYAIIHCGPTEKGQFRRTDSILKDWPAYLCIRDVNVRAINKDGVPISTVHGIYAHYGTQVLIRDVAVYQCYGAGIAVDNTWDSLVDNTKIIQCGRMSPVFGQYITDGNLGYQYQTYAPFHVLRSPTTDNSNYIRLYDTHLEDNLHSAVDIIVSGNSSPVWLKNLHLEAMTSLGGAAAGNDRSCVALGAFGVSYWGQDTEAGFDYKNKSGPDSGGYVIWDGGGMYAQTYTHMVRMTRYSAFVGSNLAFPNSGNITVNGGNQSPYVYLDNCNVGDITFSGGNGNLTPLKMTNCKAGNISMDYTYGPQMANVDAGHVTFNNMYSNNAAGPAQFSGCTFASLNGIIQFGSGDVTLTSTTVKSSFVCYYGHIDISRYAYYNATNLVGG